MTLAASDLSLSSLNFKVRRRRPQVIVRRALASSSDGGLWLARVFGRGAVSCNNIHLARVQPTWKATIAQRWLPRPLFMQQHSAARLKGKDAELHSSSSETHRRNLNQHIRGLLIKMLMIPLHQTILHVTRHHWRQRPVHVMTFNSNQKHFSSYCYQAAEA